jgi:uncharacterized protein (UPF0548 family)
VTKFLKAQESQPFSYAEVGASRGEAPAGYNVDHNRIRIGRGQADFEAAQAALRAWKMFDIGWVRLYPPDTIEVGATVLVAVSHLGFWSWNACRIVYLLDEDGPVRKYGFAYGTLPRHGERGEERFSVEWHRHDDTVWYDLYAFSQPGLWAKVLYPYTRSLQKRFAHDSKKAMSKAVQNVNWL